MVCKCDHSIGIGCGCDKMKTKVVHKTQNYFYFGKKLQYLSYQNKLMLIPRLGPLFATVCYPNQQPLAHLALFSLTPQGSFSFFVSFYILHNQPKKHRRQQTHEKNQQSNLFPKQFTFSTLKKCFCFVCDFHLFLQLFLLLGGD